MTQLFEYDTKQGMLRYILDEFTSNGIILQMMFESYDTGIIYKTLYTLKDIKLIHKLFSFDEKLIIDLISTDLLIKEIKINSKQIEVIYNMTCLTREYIIKIQCNKMIYKDINLAFDDQQRQNQVLLKRIFKLTSKIDTLQKCIQTYKLKNIYDKPNLGIYDIASMVTFEIL